MRGLEEHRARLGNINNAASLRGIEGSAAARYFTGLQAVIPGSLHFHGRNRRPPRDPFNALLSLTYTLLHSEITIALHGAGFDPYIGFITAWILVANRSPPTYWSHCDHWRIVLPLHWYIGECSTRIISPITESGCLLGKAGRVRYYAAYEEHSEILRKGINQEIEQLAEQVGSALTPESGNTPDHDSGDWE